MTNTDPVMLRFFMHWLEMEGIDPSRFRIKLHLYSDMDIPAEISYWSDALNIPDTNFKKPYMKDSVQNKRKNYKGRFGHGTCNLIVYDTPLYERVLTGIQCIREMYTESGIPRIGAV